MEGFEPDTHGAEQWSDPFKGGWIAHKQGSCIKFNVSGSIIMLQYRKTINKPAPVAYAVIDGDRQNKGLLDANFDEDWGDLCCLDEIYSGAKGEHTVEIVIDAEG